MLAYPQIDPVAIALGPLKIHWYGLMYLVGIGGGVRLGRRRLGADAGVRDARLGVVRAADDRSGAANLWPVVCLCPLSRTLRSRSAILENRATIAAAWKPGFF